VTGEAGVDRAVRQAALAGEAAALPPRVAHVTHALMARWRDLGGNGPLTAAEVCEYDSEALSARATGTALAHARRFRLASCVPGPDGNGLWWATDRAWEMRGALEDRFLREVES
jgi:hypothetical protein